MYLQMQGLHRTERLKFSQTLLYFRVLPPTEACYDKLFIVWACDTRNRSSKCFELYMGHSYVDFLFEKVVIESNMVIMNILPFHIVRILCLIRICLCIHLSFSSEFNENETLSFTFYPSSIRLLNNPPLNVFFWFSPCVFSCFLHLLHCKILDSTNLFSLPFIYVKKDSWSSTDPLEFQDCMMFPADRYVCE